ncbi:DUF1298 domain-containing protein [Nocardioides immobilis]|uniref:DUF1298 domain-containing protein n=1 Tax=Nocardioides immobilis TaxID=2049295 RepID=A0A417XTM8_9ACTN|nr:WS/DGAT domain-containing protein [Nocardioides immobilis]RHW23611.1 DUF1298 domain-containing protein [Nocardioides immobilis]
MPHSTRPCRVRAGSRGRPDACGCHAYSDHNLVISNVPATSETLYSNGAEMTDIYPVSMISEGQAMNITLTRYADQMTFGIVGDRKALPSLQRMLVHLDEALLALEKSVAG